MIASQTTSTSLEDAFSQALICVILLVGVAETSMQKRSVANHHATRGCPVASLWEETSPGLLPRDLPGDERRPIEC